MKNKEIQTTKQDNMGAALGLGLGLNIIGKIESFMLGNVLKVSMKFLICTRYTYD